MVEVHILQLMDEIELRHGVNEDRWSILRGILEKQAEREPAAQPARSEAGDCEHVELTCADPGVILPSEIGTPCPICGLPRR